ncbi:hypothetical protein DEU56DRAFT_978025 [Suillus clintonianus]|uniref:uncharacterized protein n=1 Tax=Suillus clintonianus TaxID=1904413 RepID=UPI001B8834E4|nr:uncharacterized protein DEU56DRAFT_978025 [Suillus clintonianus]KAG2149367.1 hypothetical protein DEU56DRAFT_978025 [Suillus clintonianus]
MWSPHSNPPVDFHLDENNVFRNYCTSQTLLGARGSKVKKRNTSTRRRGFPKGLFIALPLLIDSPQEQAQLASLREEQKNRSTASKDNTTKDAAPSTKDRDFEGGFGGQEDLEDRYATTSGEH